MIFSGILKKRCSSKLVSILLYFSFFSLAANSNLLAQPINNDCNNASVITIGNGGFALGLFTGSNTDLTEATLQTGETFAPSIIVAGLNKKSVWYKFTLPTTRSVRVSLLQPGSAIQAGNVGFAVYKTNTCIPGNTEISTKLSPIETFGSTFHPCVSDGEYYVQVTSNTSASGPVYLTVELADGSPAPYDKPATAYQFGDLTGKQQAFKDAEIDCQSIDDANEICLPNTSFKNYTKSIWYTFKTPAYFDYLNTWFASITTPYGQPSIKIGYRLYEGDGTTTAVGSLTQIGGCDSLMTDLYALDKKEYKCGMLKTNTTYTVQLLFHKDFKNTIRFGTEWKGDKPTNGPLPVSTLATPNKMGTLAADATTGGKSNRVADVFGCNSRHNQNSCPNSMPVGGVKANGYNFNLSSFVSFNLASTASVRFYFYLAGCSNIVYVRLFKQSTTINCNDLDTANLFTSFSYAAYTSTPLTCLAPGDYVMQIMAPDTIRPINSLSSGSLGSYPTNQLCTNYGLGSGYDVDILVRTEVASNKFDLSASGRFDKINANGAGVMQPLVAGTKYIAIPDTLGCANTVLPDSAACELPKATYRQFVAGDSLTIMNIQSSGYYGAFYKADADALATAQNKRTFPERIAGLTAYTNCVNYQVMFSPYTGQCFIPGTYTYASFDNRLNQSTSLQFDAVKPKAKFNAPARAENIGDVLAQIKASGTTWIRSAVDTFSCYDNADTIDGKAPCIVNGVPATKMIYRQFYLSDYTALSITLGENYFPYYGATTYNGLLTMFRGKATDGLNTLKFIDNKWSCNTGYRATNTCDNLEPGWYTVVAYGNGPTYQNPKGGSASPGNIYYSMVGLPNAIYFTKIDACKAPQFNRPFKASVDTVTKKPYLIEYKPQTGHTVAFPKQGTSYTLNTEYFDCRQDTAFIKQNINSCDATNVKVAFYVFTTTQEAYVKINIPDGSIWGSVYAFDVRTTDSTKLKNGVDTAFQPCLNKIGKIEFCRLLPGTYTLVLFAPANYTCNSITPGIYIDQVGYSRFDHAANAYDFGSIKPDSTWYSGKPGDVNPLNATRAPSNDFIYCTTGAREKDPTNGVICYPVYNPFIYPSTTNQVLHPSNSPTLYGNPYIDLRNIWYTFTVSQPGTIRVRAYGKNSSSKFAQDFAIYKSDEDGTVPFNTLKTGGLVDSTLLQGLTFITNNYSYYCYRASEEISMYNEPCSFKPVRYYVLVNQHYQDPINLQVEVEVLLDSVTARPPNFDHFSQANDMGLVNSGIKKGATDNFTCATKDLPDPLYAYATCQKTLWYKFTTNTTGQIRYAAFFKNTNNWYYDHIQLFRQVKPNDSSATGLLHMPYTTNYSDNGYWAQQCISPGTYYIILPGCNAVNEDVYPQIEIIPSAGDFCSAPMVTGLNGPGSKVVPVTVDCHTIGTDYGEFNPTLTCPAGGITSQYKTSWYRMDITGTDTLDVTVFINEKTNATSTDIKYRMMTGTCGAMQEQSCVQDALTRNTYKCLAPGNSYYIQVFSPVTYNGVQVTGDIDLNISAVGHADTCLPANNCIGVANFTPQFDCTKDKNVIFTNFSTFGSSIKYDWDFGYNNQKSNAVSPQFFYPALTTAQIYTATLIITNTACGKKDSVTQTITIPARPSVNLGTDTVICTNVATVALDATSHTAATYYWYNGSVQAKQSFTSTVNPWVEVTYNGCKTRDTINIWINPIAKKSLQTAALCKVDQVTLSANRGYGEQFKWSNNAVTSNIVVSQPGYYWCDVYLNGCIIRDSFLVASTALRPLGNDKNICQSGLPYLADATVSGATGYSWQDNSKNATLSITKSGLYWVDISLGGCTFRDSLTIAIDSFKQITATARICQGQTYALPTGTAINAPGVYKDSLKNSRGCDSIITTVTLVVDTVKRVINSVSLCGGQLYTLPGGTSVGTAGNYIDTVKNARGCDSLITTLNLTIATVIMTNGNATICSGSSYKLPSGKLILATGVYADTLKALAGCDSLITTLNLAVLTPILSTTTASICLGQTYTLPTGFVVTAAGVYRDTIRYAIGCDSLIRTVTLTVDPKPSLGADQLLVICFGNTFNLTSQYTTSGLTTVWTLGGATVATSTAVSTAGIYQLIASNSSSCSDTALVTLTISPKPNLGADKVASICQGNTLDLTTQFTTTGLTTNWTFAGAPIANPSVIASSGAYQLIARNTDGCSDTAIFTLTVNAKPSLGADKSTSICLGSSIDLATQYNTTGLTSVWTLNGAAITTPSSVNTAGTYQLIASTSDGCSDTALLTLGINAKPNLGIDKAAAICAGSNYNLSSQFTTTGFTGTWTLNGAAVTTLIAVTTAGVYELIVTNGTGCKDTALVTLTVNPKPALGADKAITICQGNTADLTAQFATTALSTNWTVNGTSVTNPAAVTTAGIYQLIAINGSNCSDTALVTLTANPKPVLGTDKTISICQGNTADLTTQFTTTGFTTSWILNGGAVANTNAVTTAGVYQLIVTNTSGCNDTALVTLTVNPKPAIGEDKTIDICQGNTAGLTIQFTTTGLTTNWTLNGTAVANPSGVSIAGVYQLIAVNGDGCSDTALVTLTVSPKPDLGADKSIAICAGNAVDLTAQYITTGLTSSWTNNGTAVNKPGTVNAAGIYQLIATSSAGCKDTATVTITVAPKPSLGADKAAVICSASSINLTTQFITTGFTSNWTINGAAVSTPAAVNQSGNYQLIVTNGNGCLDTALLNLTVNPSPTLGADKAVSFCTGGSINLTSQFVTAGLTSTWSLNSNTIASPTAVTASGIYQLVVANTFACTDTALVRVSINMLPTVLVADPASVCSPSTINLTAAFVTAGSTAGLNYSYWRDAANTVAVPNAGAVPSGLYYIKGTDANGCFDSRPVTVIVYALPVVNAGRDTAICDQSFATLKGTATNLGIGTVSYLWSPATGLSSTTTATTVATPGASATYRLTASVDYGTCVLSVADDVRISMQPPIVAFAGNDTVAVSGVPHQLRASGGVNYLWSPASVLNNSTIAKPLATLRQDTRFTVMVTDIAGCKASATVLVKVYNGITYYLPNAFSPNGDGLNEVFRPIPAGIVSTEYFRIFSRYGQLIFETSQPLKGWDGTFKGIRQPVGNYVWSIKGMGNNGKVVEMKGNVVLVR